MLLQVTEMERWFRDMSHNTSKFKRQFNKWRTYDAEVKERHIIYE